MKIHILNSINSPKATEHTIELKENEILKDTSEILLQIITKICPTFINYTLSKDDILKKFEIEIVTSSALNDKGIYNKTYVFTISKTDLESSFNVIIDKVTKELKSQNNSTLNFNFSSDTRILIRNTSLFPQISMAKAVTISYSFPIIIITIMLFTQKHVDLSDLSLKQILVYILMIIHFLKRTYESNFVNIYTGKLDFFFLLSLCFYYWILFAGIVSYYVFSNKYLENNVSINDSNEKTNLYFHYVDTRALTDVLFALCFLYCEKQNYNCHMILRNLKIKNKGFRGIPEGNMFDYVSSAHYFWELMTWVVFFMIVGHWSAMLLVFYSFTSMFAMAYKKHNSYLSYFKEKYPKDRKIMIPYLL